MPAHGRPTHNCVASNPFDENSSPKKSMTYLVRPGKRHACSNKCIYNTN